MNKSKKRRGRHACQPTIGRRPRRTNPHVCRAARRGFSLLEFSVASVIVGILMIGLTSSIHLVTRAAALSEGPTSQTAEAARCIEEMVADMRMAGVFKEREQSRVTFNVPDRDGDAAAEEVTFDWRTNGDGTLRKMITMSDSEDPPESQVLLTGVSRFNLEYLTRRWGPPPSQKEIESEERLLIAHDDFPQAAGNRLLMVIGDVDQPIAQEAARTALVEDWGFVVEWISDHASRSDFDAALDRSDVVYVASTADADQVDLKLKETTLGVVNEQPLLADEFGLAGSLGSSSSSTVLGQSVGTHFLTYGWLPEAPVTLYSSGQPGHNLHPDRDRLAPEIEVLATRNGQPALAVMPIEGELFQFDHHKGKRLGETEVLSEQSEHWDFAERYVANRWTLTHIAECLSLTAYVSAPGGKDIRFGIYTDVNGRPGNRIAQTDRYRLNWGPPRWVTVDLDSPVILEPGNYWLAIGMESGVKVRYEPSGGVACWADNGSNPTNWMMNQWWGTYGPSVNEHRYSLHATYNIIERAAGRRVQLPWGIDSLDVASLSEDGRALLQRSLQWAADPSPADQGASWQVTSDAWPAQYFYPDLPTNATGWKLTRLFCRLRADPASSSTSVGFRLTHSDLQQRPSTFEIQRMNGVGIDPVSDNRFRWFEIPIDATGDLRPDRGVCFLVRGYTSGPEVLCQFDQGSPDTPGTQLCESWNAGSHWSANNATHDLRFYAYGKYLTSGEPKW